MRALITGGAGFIGSHLSEALLNDGHHVVALDDLSTGSIDNVLRLKSHPHFVYHIDTIMNEPLLAQYIDQCDVVFHLAAAVGVRLIVDAPVRTIETNVKGTEVVLRHAAKKRRLVLIASTSEVYGKGVNIPFAEDADLVLGPTGKHRWACACSKAVDEFLGLAYWKEKRVPVIIARLFNTVGPRQTGRYGMVVPSFVGQALTGKPITIFGDGSQTRSFAYVGDVVRALICLVNEPKATGDIFNVGNDDEVSIGALAETIKSMTESSSEIVTIPYNQAYEAGFEDIPRRVPDLRKIEALFGWRPRVPLHETLTRIIDHARQNLAQ